MPNVLIFENDKTFADELAEGLRNLGCEVQIASDANIGLQSAAVTKPDLILLAIELPRMNGFSVCNKVKRDPVLKEVPLIIMSSDSTEETFEQHRRLRTRAEDYVHKPIGFSQLLPHIKAFLPLGEPAEFAEESLLVDDDIVLAEDEVLEIEEEQPAPSVDQDVDNFTEAAFGNIIAGPTPEEAPASEANEAADFDAEMVDVGDSVPPMSEERLEVAEASIRPEPSDVTAPASVPPTSERSGLVLRLQRELSEARGTIDELEQQLRAKAGLEADVAHLRGELEEAKARISSGKGASAREVLDLREQLNRKDKEILEVRDKLTHKDKELLALKDGTLALERDRADLTEKIDELGRRISELERLNDSLGKDKDQANKRSEDFKRRAEKTKSELDEKFAELDAQRAAEAALREEHRSALEAAAERQELAVAQAIQATRREADEEKLAALTEATRAAETAQQEALRAAEAHLSATHAEALARAEEEAALKLAEQEHKSDDLRRSLGEVRAQLEQVGEERDSAIATIREREAKIGLLENELAGRIEERDSARREIADRGSRISVLESEVASAEGRLTAAHQELEVCKSQLDAARAKWAADKAALELAKDGMAAALLQIDEIEARSLE